jgi:transposase
MRISLDPSCPTYFVGIDLALCAKHVGVVLDAQGCHVGKAFQFGHSSEDFAAARSTVCERLPQDAQIVWAAEPSGGAWIPWTAFLTRHGDIAVLQKPYKVSDLRKYEHRHYKTDRADARTIASATRMDVQAGLAVSPPPSPKLRAQRSLARRLDELTHQEGSAKNRVVSMVTHELMPALADHEVDLTTDSILKVLHHFAAVPDIAKRSLNGFTNTARGARIGTARASERALAAIHAAAHDAIAIYGADGVVWKAKALLIKEAIEAIWDIQRRKHSLQTELDTMLNEDCDQTTRQRALSVPGVGPTSLDCLIAFFGPPEQWPDISAIRQYSGLVPVVDRSGQSESQHKMSKLGEAIIRKVVYQVGNVARQFDARCAACYYHQMVDRGKVHTTATIYAGIKAIDALRAVARRDTPYEHRDPQTGLPVTKQQSRELATTRYAVPEHIRAERRKTKHSDRPKQTRGVKDVP